MVLKQQGDPANMTYFLKPAVSIKKFILFQSSDDEDMEAEAGAILGVTNLMIKKQLKTNSTLSLKDDVDLGLALPAFKLSHEKLDFQIVPGFADLTLYEPTIFPDSPLLSHDRATVYSLSQGFKSAEEKNIKKHKARQEALRRKALLANKTQRQEDL